MGKVVFDMPPNKGVECIEAGEGTPTKGSACKSKTNLGCMYITPKRRKNTQNQKIKTCCPVEWTGGIEENGIPGGPDCPNWP